ncbi:MAG: 1-deoxy-D-xylulose-5-phosphate reductoisomerase [Clostridiaceae bacterium]|nr:1-deoxy-D-xylulose-5-phosphate reductoisomerase [Clostridiaceae bacterium]
MKKLAIIGSTGSVGTQAAELAAAKGYSVPALACGSDIIKAEEQIRLLKPSFFGMMDIENAKELSRRVSDTGCIVEGGEQAVLKAASFEDCDIVLNAVTGIAGLASTMAAIDSCKVLALANKESLVCAGKIVMGRAKKNNVSILPVDSEHSAIFQCMQAGKTEEIDKLILTASGGPFFGWNKKMLLGVKSRDALRHPTWSMGKKITVDSASMMNKGFEVIEASWLFNMPADKIDVVVHRESIVHSMVKYIDGSLIAQLGNHDMRLPIQYALSYPERTRYPFETLDVFKLGSLSFYPPDRETFPCLSLCEQAAVQGGNTGAVINGANEVAVAAFLKDQIGFLDIYEIVVRALDRVSFIANPCLEEIYASDKMAREAALSAL